MDKENGSSQKAGDFKLKKKRKREREKNMLRKKRRKLEASREMLEDEEQNKSFKSKSRYLNMKIQGRGARRSQESDHSQLQPSPLRDIGVHIDQNKRKNQRRGRSDQPKSSQLCTSPAAPPPVTSFYKGKWSQRIAGKWSQRIAGLEDLCLSPTLNK